MDDRRSKKMGARIREIRRRRNWTQERLANAIDVTRQQLGRLENGKRTLRPATLARIAEALEVPLEWLEADVDRRTEVADLFSRLGLQVWTDRALPGRGGIQYHADVEARLQVGFIELRVLVQCPVALDREFLGRLDAFLHESTYHLGVVVTEEPSEQAVKNHAAELGIHVLTRDELEHRLLDLRSHVRPFARIPDEDGFEYIAQECSYVGSAAEDRDPATIDEVLDEWLAGDQPRHLVVLGDPGVGKTTVCRRLAARLASRYIDDPVNEPAPLLVPLWEFPYVSDLRRLLFRDLLLCHGHALPGSGALEYMLNRGRFVVILDGLDEMTARGDPQRHVANIRSIAELMEAGSRVLLTSRKRFFQDTAELESILSARGRWLNQLDGSTDVVRAVELHGFDDRRIEEYLHRERKRSWQRILELLEKYHLKELAKIPLVLNLLARHPPQHPYEGRPDLADVLHQAFEHWARQEAARLSTTREAMIEVLEKIASDISERITRKQHPSVTLEEVEGILEDIYGDYWKHHPPATRGLYHPLGRSLFLKQEEDRSKVKPGERVRFRITHDIFRQYLLARDIVRHVPEGNWYADQLWADDLLAELLAKMARKPIVYEGMERILASHDKWEVRSEVAFLLGRVSDAPSTQGLEAALNDEDPAVVAAAAYALAWLGAPGALERLATCARSGEDSIRRRFARLDLLTLELDAAWYRRESLRAATAEVRQGLEAPDVEALHQEVKDSSLHLGYRCAAVRCLGLLDDPSSKEILFWIEEHGETPRLRWAAFHALRGSGGSSAAAPRPEGARSPAEVQ